jgi:hypothetical protein
MSDDNATAVLASSQFRNGLRLVRQINNNCRLPIRRASGKIKLLSEGYDDAGQTLTIDSVEYSTNMPLVDAVATINDLMSEFIFADGVRSKAVAVSAMVGLYANGLLPPMTLRPCFIELESYGVPAGSNISGFTPQLVMEFVFQRPDHLLLASRYGSR